MNWFILKSWLSDISMNNFSKEENVIEKRREFSQKQTFVTSIPFVYLQEMLITWMKLELGLIDQFSFFFSINFIFQVDPSKNVRICWWLRENQNCNYTGRLVTLFFEMIIWYEYRSICGCCFWEMWITQKVSLDEVNLESVQSNISYLCLFWMEISFDVRGLHPFLLCSSQPTTRKQTFIEVEVANLHQLTFQLANAFATARSYQNLDRCHRLFISKLIENFEIVIWE